MKLELSNIDRRLIYLMVLLALCIPLAYQYAAKPARMKSAERFFQIVDNLPSEAGKIALVVLDYGPNSMAENLPQSQMVIEHLMRRRIPFAVYSQYVLAGAFLESVPAQVAEKLMREAPGERWEYGKDWVNLGYRPGASIMIQSIAQSEDLVSLLKNDARGNSLAELPAFSGVRSIRDVRLMAQFTSLIGTLDTFLQFFRRKDYRPVFLHGCTSITIPQAFIYLDSGQLSGLMEGIVGAAWYSQLLQQRYPSRVKDSFQVVNTGLGIAQLVVIALVILGNVAAFLKRRSA